jgi:hypothetical protein
MRIDSATGVKAWLIGKFSGSFKGYLRGTADSASYVESAATAESASYSLSTSYAETASYIPSENFGVVLNDALDDPKNKDVFERLKSSGRLVVNGGIRVVSGSVELDTGSLRIRRVVLEYDDLEEALGFKFISGGEIPPVPTGSIKPVPPEPEPPVPPCPPPYPWPRPPVPPFPPYPPVPPKPVGSTSSISVDYYRDGRY